MPVGTAPLSQDELAAIQLWIKKGAPEKGSVADPVAGLDVGSLLDACLPPPEPMPVKPLDPPDPQEGIQFILPPYLLKAGTRDRELRAVRVRLHGQGAGASTRTKRATSCS